jgi:aminoglycoside phosphotransferase (APT) family kinase protein
MTTDTLTRVALDTQGLSPIDQQVHDWLTDRFGAPPSAFNRVLRWRMGWEATVEVDGQQRDVVVRSARGGIYEPPISLEQEARIHDVMEANGVRAPHVYGMIEKPLAFVMEKLEGGIDTSLIEDPDAQWKVRREFIDALARLHRIPVEQFGAIGLAVPEQPSLGSLENYKSTCQHVRRVAGETPIPYLEFLDRWLERHQPNRDRSGFVTGDSGQFMYEGDRFTGLIDFEMGYIGDPAADFGGFRVRDTTEPLGEIGLLRDYYETVSGDHLPNRLISYYTAGFAGSAAVLNWLLVLQCDPGVDFVAYLQFTAATCRWGIQGILEYMGLEIETIAKPEANNPFPFAFTGTQARNHATAWTTENKALEYHLQADEAIAHYLERCATYGQSVLEADLAEIAALTGRRAWTREEADRQLADWICNESTSDHDADLARFFNRTLQRQSFLLKGCGSQALYNDVWLRPVSARAAQ